MRAPQHDVRQTFPRGNAADLAAAGWAFAHGMAFLHLDGKLAREPRGAVAERVRAAFDAFLSVQPG